MYTDAGADRGPRVDVDVLSSRLLSRISIRIQRVPERRINGRPGESRLKSCTMITRRQSNVEISSSTDWKPGTLLDPSPPPPPPPTIDADAKRRGRVSRKRANDGRESPEKTDGNTFENLPKPIAVCLLDHAWGTFFSALLSGGTNLFRDPVGILLGG